MEEMTTDERQVAGQIANFQQAVQGIIHRTCIIDYGIIKKVEADGIVTVLMSSALDNRDVKITTCVYANIASKALTLQIKPNEGDKVLVIYPKRFNLDMFDTTQEEAIIDEYSAGYNLLMGIAIPINQYKEGQHNNFITVNEDGTIDAHLQYDEEKKANQINLTINKYGKLTCTSGDNTVNVNVQGVDDEGKALKEGEKWIVIDDSNGHSLVSSDKSLTVTDAFGDMIQSLDGGSDGISVTVVNKISDSESNTVVLNKDGISVTDVKGNTVVAGDKSIVVTNKISDSDKNTVTLNNDGAKIVDKNKNEITMSSDGTTIKDKSGNKIEGTSSGLKITDKNSGTIEMSSTGTKINGKLEIKK